MAIAKKVADWMSVLLAWSDAKKISELARYENLTDNSYLPGPHFAPANVDAENSQASSVSGMKSASNT